MAFRRGGGEMRHPVSTRGYVEGRSGAMQVRLVRGSGVPGSPEHADPGSSKDANSVRVVAAARARAVIDVSGPRMGVAGLIGQAGKRAAQAVVAGESEHDAAVLARFVGDGGDAGFG